MGYVCEDLVSPSYELCVCEDLVGPSYVLCV